MAKGPKLGRVSHEIAALFVATHGVYFGLPDVEPYDVNRNAFSYQGPHPVVAHPPCERWGRYWSGGPSAKIRRIKGDDGGAFAFAVRCVREFGGVLEHPEASHAFGAYGLTKPPKLGGWIACRDLRGWTCCVEQGHYGHRARKATWLYFCGSAKPMGLIWGPSTGARLDEGFHSKSERDAARTAGQKPVARLSTRENIATPTPFRDLLLDLARQSASVQESE
jgi:hypothetical protein